MSVIAENPPVAENTTIITTNGAKSRPPTELEKLWKGPRMTKEFILAHCKQHKLYQTPHLNDVLYLHYKGFSRIENLEEYTGLKCLWLENNGIDLISGLDYQTDLRSLYLHYNLIKKIENLDKCVNLNTLNLSHNQVRKIENLDGIPKLQSLNLGNNYIETLEEMEHLEKLIEVSVLDLSNNHIEDPLVVHIFSMMPNLRVLCLNGNPVIRKIPAYRKTVTLACKQLRYLDDRPIFPRDRACAEAWERGGITEEQAERQRWIDRDNQKIMDSVNGLIRLRDERRAQRQLQQQDSGMGASINDSESEQDSLTEDISRKTTVDESSRNQPTEEDTSDDERSISIPYDYAKACEESEQEMYRNPDDDENDESENDNFMDNRETTEDYSDYSENIFDFSPRVKVGKQRKMVQEMSDDISDIEIKNETQNVSPQENYDISPREQANSEYVKTLQKATENFTKLTEMNQSEDNLIEIKMETDQKHSEYAQALQRAAENFMRLTETDSKQCNYDSKEHDEPKEHKDGLTEPLIEELVNHDQDEEDDNSIFEQRKATKCLMDINEPETENIISVAEEKKQIIKEEEQPKEDHNENNKKESDNNDHNPSSESKQTEAEENDHNSTPNEVKSENNDESVLISTESQTGEESKQEASSTTGIVVSKKQKKTNLSVSIGLQTEPFESEEETPKTFSDPLDELVQIYSNKVQVSSSDSDSDSSSDDGEEKPFYKQLDKTITKCTKTKQIQEKPDEDASTNEPPVKIFKRSDESEEHSENGKSKFHNTITVGESEYTVNDVRELLSWQMKTSTENIVFPLAREKKSKTDQQDEMIDYEECDTYKIIDAKVQQKEESDNGEPPQHYKRYVEKPQQHQEPMITNILRMSRSIPIYRKGEAVDEDKDQGTEKENALIVTNNISELRVDMQRFSDELQAYTERYNRQYQELMQQFVDNYNACSERDKQEQQIENKEKHEEEIIETDTIESVASEIDEIKLQITPTDTLTISYDPQTESATFSLEVDESIINQQDEANGINTYEEQLKEITKITQEEFYNSKEELEDLGVMEETNRKLCEKLIQESTANGEEKQEETITKVSENLEYQDEKEKSTIEKDDDDDEIWNDDTPIIKRNITCTLEMQLAQQTE
ncbi:hypothetical protein ILUMI_05342 [Ignelater luminosus]|uniref:Dynein axonemal assembly factor 1 homolog n=1 Tax=Ignelater luminosus TaxID=2038154 RepID=A0A8K0D7E0_IGNLU|nr:hypothetical protein ILUMI_05342 [Ignelater luminosus]